MRTISADELRKIMLDILKDVTAFCDANGITYFLSCGTLIGAIRHHGFIPWDDDIDIDMPRNDYERFIELYSQKGKYAICSPYDKNSMFFFTKVYDERTVKKEEIIRHHDYNPIGVDIDIFPIDGQPDDFEKFKKDTNFRHRLFGLFLLSLKPISKLSLKVTMLSIISHLIGWRRLLNTYIKSAKKYNYSTSSNVGFISPYSQYNNRHHKDIFEKKIKVRFEDGEFWIPEDYDTVLTNIYGDYMTPPPLEKRTSTHIASYFWKD
ncbi:MAG: phosphorylcholine transferase LicD [Candidatus Limimorpha sp.]